MQLLTQIIENNILPVLFIILMGFLLEKKFKLDINTLSKINFYIVVPSYLFVSLYESNIDKSLVKVFIFVILFLIVNFLIGYLICKLARVDNERKAGFQNSIMFYNSGNMGIPIITLVFTNAPFVINGQTPYLTLALTIQVIVMVVQNISINTVGFLNMGASKFDLNKSVKRIFSMPVIYMIPLIVIIKLLNIEISEMSFYTSLIYLKNSMICIALVTLGVQLGKVKFNLRDKLIYIAVFIRLILGPIVAYFIMIIVGIEGVMLKSLLVAVSMPTAVNVALISVECDASQDFVSQIVMMSTLLSPLTITLVIAYIIKFL